MIYLLRERTVPRIEQLDQVVIAAFELLVFTGFFADREELISSQVGESKILSTNWPHEENPSLTLTTVNY